MEKRRVVLAAALLAAVLPALVPARPTGSEPQAPFDPEAALRSLRSRIAGRENRPAEEVFANVTTLKGMPAGRLLAVMSNGFSRSLGVDCTHCHVRDKWESDERPAKRIAREMWRMTMAINADHLQRIEGLGGRNPVVNCTTCHRGQLKPALNLAESAPRTAPPPAGVAMPSRWIRASGAVRRP